MKSRMMVIVAVMALAGAAFAEDGFNTAWADGWRLTVGPQFNFGMKGRFGVRRSAVPVPSAASSTGSRDAAQAAGDAIGAGPGRMKFPNGAYIDPEDSAGTDGETWNWHVPAGAMKNGKMSFVNAYSEQSSVYEGKGGSCADDTYSIGVNFSLDRSLWKDGRFGVDVGFNFSFFIRDNWFKGRVGGYARTDTYIDGAYETDVDLGNADVLSHPWAWNPDGSYGGGTYDGPGPVLSIDEVSITHHWGDERRRTSTVSSGPLTIRGDLQMYEFQLALKPYYELTDWFMLRGTLGVGLDYRNLDVSVSGTGKSSADDWDCYMVCGLGGMFHWRNICLGADVMRKVFDDDMTVDTRYVNGRVGNADWILRLYLGYEF